MAETSRCHDCGNPIDTAEAAEGIARGLSEWADAVGFGCAGRGDPDASPAEVLPHRPTFVQVDAFPTFKPMRYPTSEFAR